MPWPARASDEANELVPVANRLTAAARFLTACVRLEMAVPKLLVARLIADVPLKVSRLMCRVLAIPVARSLSARSSLDPASQAMGTLVLSSLMFPRVLPVASRVPVVLVTVPATLELPTRSYVHAPLLASF